MKSRADKLFAKALATGDPRGANRLLGEFARGYPLERLRLLLRSENPETVRTGVFIASELGRAAKPLIDEFSALLKHDEFRVRFDVLDCVLVCATERNGDLVARAVSLVHDPERAVRWKALGFLSRAIEAQLRAALPFIEAPDLRAALSWLTSERSMNHQAILEGLRDPNLLTRRVAVAAAARPEHFDANALEEAASSNDLEVGEFALDELEIRGVKPG